jgi:hypothetical protein
MTERILAALINVLVWGIAAWILAYLLIVWTARDEPPRSRANVVTTPAEAVNACTDEKAPSTKYRASGILASENQASGCRNQAAIESNLRFVITRI